MTEQDFVRGWIKLSELGHPIFTDKGLCKYLLTGNIYPSNEPVWLYEWIRRQDDSTAELSMRMVCFESFNMRRG